MRSAVRLFALFVCIAGANGLQAKDAASFEAALDLFAGACRDPDINFSQQNRIEELGWLPLENAAKPELDADIARVIADAKQEPDFSLILKAYMQPNDLGGIVLITGTQTDASDITISTCSIHFPDIERIPTLEKIGEFFKQAGEDWSDDPSDMINVDQFRSYYWDTVWSGDVDVNLTYLPPSHPRIFVFGSEVKRGLILSAEK